MFVQEVKPTRHLMEKYIHSGVSYDEFVKDDRSHGPAGDTSALDVQAGKMSVTV